MAKYFFIRLMICLGFCIILSACAGFIGCIVTVLFEMSMRTIYIFSGILGIIGTIIVMVILHFIFLGETPQDLVSENLLERYKEDKSFMAFWDNMRANRKRVSIWKCLLWLLPLAAIGTVMLILAKNTHFKFDYRDESLIMLGKVVSGNVIGINCVYWNLIFIYSVFHYLRVTCIKCGAVLPFIEDNISDYNSVDNIQTKRSDIYGTIGTVYSGNEKVGDVRGKVGTVEKKYRTWGSTYNSHCHCLYCGKRRKFHVNDVSTERIE